MDIAICDNEQICIDDIIRHLDYFSAENNIDFEKYIFTKSADVTASGIKFDIAVLDVEMDDMNGIKLGEKLREQNPHIILIYVTAHKKYLDEFRSEIGHLNKTVKDVSDDNARLNCRVEALNGTILI